MTILSSYKINGSAMSVGPMKTTWVYPARGMGLNGEAKYSSRAQVTLEFGEHSLEDAFQWVNAVSGGSFSITMPQRGSLSFVTYAGVNGDVISWPSLIDVHASEFQIVINGVI